MSKKKQETFVPTMCNLDYRWFNGKRKKRIYEKGNTTIIYDRFKNKIIKYKKNWITKQVETCAFTINEILALNKEIEDDFYLRKF